jgi:hypothetical protein
MNEQGARTALRDFARRVEEHNGDTHLVEVEGESIVLRRTPATHWAICSWALGSVAGLFLHGLGRYSETIGCYSEIFVTTNELHLLIAAPNLEAFNATLTNVEESNEVFRTTESNVITSFTLWVRGANREPFLLSEYRFEDVEEGD